MQINLKDVSVKHCEECHLVTMFCTSQYIEGGKLERAWKSTRRERLKQREEKIWDEFVKEKDVVKDAFSGNYHV